jgi:L-rhamnonate dehydratase
LIGDRQEDEVIPMFSPLLLDEPVPHNGRMKLPDTPGFGVRLNPACQLHRPYRYETVIA